MTGTDGRPVATRQSGQGDPLEAAEFISTHLTPLAQMAWHHRLEALGYLLDMAKLEADEMCKSLRGRRGSSSSSD